jgi:hypothetical protein
MANTAKNKDRFRCSDEEFPAFERAKTFLRLGFGLQVVDKNGQPIETLWPPEVVAS